MTYQAVLAIRVSAGFHFALLLAGLALTASTKPIHVHLVRGTAVWEAAFAAAESSTATIPVVAIPSTQILEYQPAIALVPAAMELRRVIPVETSLVRGELPKLPEAIEDCDCIAPEMLLHTPKRELPEILPTVTTPPVVEPKSRQQSEVDLAVDTEVVLPSSAEVAGSEVDELPKKLAFNPPPPYPREAYLLGQQGMLILEVKVNTEGMVDSIRVVQSSGVDSLDESALSTVRKWRFEPARRGGLAVTATVNVPVRFRIR
jgi:protein TonB